MRRLVVATVLVALRLTLGLLSRIVPQTRSVVVSAYPETEGNGVEVARALLRRYDGRVVWLRDNGPVPVEIDVLAGDGLVLLPKGSLRGLVSYLRAEAVLFTHGLYGSPRPVERKPVVNLWHGDGPKDVRPDNGVGALIASTFMVGSTRLFSTHQAAAFDVPEDRVLVTGNPRTDQLWRPIEASALGELGITGDFVVWMPTFRRTRAVGAMREQSETVREGRDGLEELAALREGLGARGIQLVVKPHPMDAEQHHYDGAVTITDADLLRAEVSLYAVIARSRGLVTDYSSVWVDYLLLDRPLAFFVPDRDSYTRKLVPPDVLDWAPGELVGPERPFCEFLADLDNDGSKGGLLRAAAAARIGLNPTHTSADDLLTELESRGVLNLGG